MEDFERQLKDALSRKEPSPSFEAKVFGAIAAQQTGRIRFWRWAAALAVMLLVVAGFWMRHERQIEERAAGEAAKARLQLALRITVTELAKIQKSVRTSTEE